MNIKIKWKMLADDLSIAKVYGGWLLREQCRWALNDNIQNINRHRGTHEQVVIPPVMTVFIPDPDHMWEKLNEMNKLMTGDSHEKSNENSGEFNSSNRYSINP